MVTTGIIPKRIYESAFAYTIAEYPTADLISLATRSKSDALFIGERRISPRTISYVYWDGAINQNMIAAGHAEIAAVHAAGLQYIVGFAPNRNPTDDHYTYDLNNATQRASRVAIIQEYIDIYPEIDGVQFEELAGRTAYEGLALFFQEVQFVRTQNKTGTNRTISFNCATVNDPVEPSPSFINRADIDSKHYVDYVCLQTSETYVSAAIDSVNRWQTIMPGTKIIPAAYGYTSATMKDCGYSAPYSYPACYARGLFDIIHHFNAVANSSVLIAQIVPNLDVDPWYQYRSQEVKNLYGSGAINIITYMGKIPLSTGSPSPGTGTLNISSAPPHADIWIDGSNDNTGYTPMNLSLPAGTYSIKLVLPGYNNVTDTITISSGQTLIKSYPMTPVTVPPPPCVPVWQCESPANGYELDGCGNRQINTLCNPVIPPQPKTQFLILAGIGIGLMAMLKKK